MVIASIAVGTLWLQKFSLEKLKVQKKLDQCLYSVLERRCETLNSISKMNEKLRVITATVAEFQAAGVASLFIPGMQGGFLASEKSILALRKLSLHTSKLQDVHVAALAIEKMSVWKCGITKDYEQLLFTRKLKPVHTITKTSPPLVLAQETANETIFIQSPSGSTGAYGYCKPQRGRQRKDGVPWANQPKENRLQGEIYLPALEKKVSSQSKRFSALPLESSFSLRF